MEEDARARSRKTHHETRDVDARARGNPREAGSDQHGHPHPGEPPGVRFLRAPFSSISPDGPEKVAGSAQHLMNDRLMYSTREPLGVVGHHRSLEYPLKLMSRGLAAALACGTRWSSNPPPSHWPRWLYFRKTGRRSRIPAGVSQHCRGLGTLDGRQARWAIRTSEKSSSPAVRRAARSSGARRQERDARAGGVGRQGSHHRL